MPENSTFSRPYRVQDLPARKPVHFKIVPDAEDCRIIAEEIGADALRKLSFSGQLRPSGRHDFVLEGDLRATVVQPCVATLAPVTTRIEERVTRRYLADMPEPEGEEVEMPEDDSAESLPAVIDLGEVLIEALSLALPLYPRAADAPEEDHVVTEPGATPLSDEAIKPFAALAALRDKLAPGTESGQKTGTKDDAERPEPGSDTKPSDR